MASTTTCDADSKCAHDKWKDKPKYTRLLICQSPNCDKHFHAGCIGYEKKSESEIKNLFFLCTKCTEYVTQTNQMVESLINSAMTNLKESIYEEIRNAKKDIMEVIRTEISSFKSEMEDRLHLVSINNNETTTGGSKHLQIPLLEQEMIQTTLNTSSDNDTAIQVDAPTTEEVIQQDATEDADKAPGILEIQTNVLTTEEEIDQDIEKIKIVCKEWFLSGVEAYLNIDQIKNILQDNKVCTYGIQLEEQEGSFVKRKFVRVVSKNNTALARLLTTFRDSTLGSKWNLRATRPQLRILKRENNTKTECSIRLSNRAEFERENPRYWNNRSQNDPRQNPLQPKNCYGTLHRAPPWQQPNIASSYLNNPQPLLQTCPPLTPSSQLHPSYASALQTGLVASHQLPYTQNQQMSQIVTALKGLKQIFAEFQV